MPIRSEELAYVRDLVRKKSAIVIEEGKDYLIESRLTQVARTAGFEGVEAMLTHMKKSPVNGLHTQVVEAMTTNETSFFRDLHPFDALRTKILPELAVSRAASRTLRIWCAAASTGQEPYTLAMCVRDLPVFDNWTVQIIATDINTEVLDRARAGVFKQLEVNRGLPVAMLVKHFDRVNADWQVKPHLKQMVQFQELNLLHRWPLFAQQDIVFMRNVLIYFDLPTKRGILQRIREHLRGDGYLALGGAETTLNIDPDYVPVRHGASVFYQAKANTETKGACNAVR